MGWGGSRWAALLASGDDVAALARLRVLVHTRRPAASAADLRQRRLRPTGAAPAAADASAFARVAAWIRGGGGGGAGSSSGGGGSGGGSSSSSIGGPSSTFGGSGSSKGGSIGGPSGVFGSSGGTRGGGISGPSGTFGGAAPSGGSGGTFGGDGGSRGSSIGAPSGIGGGGGNSSVGGGGRREGAGAALTELGELYAQAARAEPLLRRTAMRLAAATRGAFPVAGPAGAEDAAGVGRREAAGGELLSAAALERDWGAAAVERVRWAGLKPSGRAMEKLVRHHAAALPPRFIACIRARAGTWM